MSRETARKFIGNAVVLAGRRLVSEWSMFVAESQGPVKEASVLAIKES